MRICYDSTSSGDIPASAQLVAGYLDGLYRWTGQDWGRFPNAIKVGIACFASTDAGQVLDVETGDATPQQAPSWVAKRRAAGVDPTVYVNRSNWAATRLAFQQQGVPEPHYWLAAYDGIAEVPVGCVAKQYADSAISGGHYDLSAVLDHWPGVDPSNPNATAATEVIAGGSAVHLSEKRALVRLAYLAGMGREPESQQVLDNWANGIADDGSNAEDMVIKIADSPEAITHRQAYGKTAPHDHQVSGTAR